MFKRLIRLLPMALLAVALFAMLALLALGVQAPRAIAYGGEPLPGTVVGVQVRTFQAAKVITGSTTTYAAPAQADISNILPWHAADVFVTAAMTSSTSMTVTAQFSADGNNWADAYYAEVLGSAIVATSSTSTTVSSTSTDTRAMTPVKYRLVFGYTTLTNYMRLPMAGQFMRFKIEHTGTVTPTILAVLRNDR